MEPMNFDVFRDNPDLRYAAKHKLESSIHAWGIWQCDVFRPQKNLIATGTPFLFDKEGNAIRDNRGRFLVSGGRPEPPNLFTTEGMNYLLDIIFYTTSKAGSKIWYVGLFKNNVTPANGNTASVHLGSGGTYGAIQATTDMDEAAYQSYNTATASSASITNSANKAEFTIAASITLYGAFLGDSSDPTDTTGHLMAAKKFTSSRAVIDDDAVSVTYTITLTSS